MINFKYLTSGNEERIFDYMNSMSYCRDCFCNKVYIRFLHAVEGVPAVDVYIDGILVAYGLSYGEVTQYVLSYPGEYNVTVYRNNQTENPILEKSVEFYRNSVYTAAIAGTLQSYDLYLIKEYKQENEPENEAVISYTNLSPGDAEYDLMLADGTIVYRNVGFSETMPNVLLMPVSERFIINIAGTDTEVSSTGAVQLDRNTYYSIFSIGVGEQTNLFVIKSGLNYLDIC